MRAGVVGFAAIFALIGCTGDDVADQNDSADSGFDSAVAIESGEDASCPAIPTGLNAYPGYCCETESRYCAENSTICARTLATAENPATWIGDASVDDLSCVYESTNTCNGEIGFRTSGVDFFTTYYFDATTGWFVGFGNEVNGKLFCAGAVAPIDCDDAFNPGASPCCTWTFKTVVQGAYDCFASLDAGEAD
jgi:hypothetical protein